MIREYAKAETKKGVCRVETHLAGLPERLDAAEMRDLSLVLREAVGNAVKHGKARKVAIASDPLPDGGWRLRISNDGAPFDAQTARGASEGHFGVEGMKARARRFGAELTLGVESGTPSSPSSAEGASEAVSPSRRRCLRSRLRWRRTGTSC